MSGYTLYYYPKSNIARRENLDGKVLEVYAMTLGEARDFCSRSGVDLVVEN